MAFVTNAILINSNILKKLNISIDYFQNENKDSDVQFAKMLRDKVNFILFIFII
jgi:hypothetical protein